ncbi:MAG: hypothetical protein WCO42_00290 [bacterium]
MLTLLLSLLTMGGLWVGLHYGCHLHVWSVVISVLAGVGIQVSSTLWIRKRINSIMAGIQARITERNNVLKRKYEQLASRGGNIRFIMDQARKDQDAMLTEALETTRKMDPYCRWSLLLDRQINALRVQFLFQLKKFDEVDRLLPKTMLADPILCCMKMCRQYHLGEEAELQKTYDKYRKKFKHDATLIYASYAWMLIRKKQTEKALKVLVDGKTATDDETLEKNWEHVANGRFNQFSNSGLGESWYALLLEEPKQPKQPAPRQVRPGSKFRRF